MEIYGCQFLKTKEKTEEKISQVLGKDSDLFQNYKMYIRYTYFCSTVMAAHILHGKVCARNGEKNNISIFNSLQTHFKTNSLSGVACFSLGFLFY